MNIDLSCLKLTRIGFLSKFLQMHPNVHTIDLSGNNVCSDDMAELADVLKKNLMIQRIEFGKEGTS